MKEVAILNMIDDIPPVHYPFLRSGSLGVSKFELSVAAATGTALMLTIIRDLTDRKSG